MSALLHPPQDVPKKKAPNDDSFFSQRNSKASARCRGKGSSFHLVVPRIFLWSLGWEQVLETPTSPPRNKKKVGTRTQETFIRVVDWWPWIKAAKPWKPLLRSIRYHLWRIVSENVLWGQICNLALRLVDEMTIFIPNLEVKKTSWKVQLAKVSRYSCRHLQGGGWRTPLKNIIYVKLHYLPLLE